MYVAQYDDCAGLGCAGLGCGTCGLSGLTMDGTGVFGTGLFASGFNVSSWGAGEYAAVGLGLYMLASSLLTTRRAAKRVRAGVRGAYRGGLREARAAV